MGVRIQNGLLSTCDFIHCDTHWFRPFRLEQYSADLLSEATSVESIFIFLLAELFDVSLGLFTFVKLNGEEELVELALKPPNVANGLLGASFCQKEKTWFMIQFPAIWVLVRTGVLIYLAIQELIKLTLVKSGMANFDIHSFLSSRSLLSKYINYCGINLLEI
jgi:hypothetical protein